ncbi:hypothetical protein Forpe1208_v005476 [Fusarium oxysporum f. sp. rapae]|uniref:Uncharacterized protein n=1 Tax=Fusarium oxysporum f. sp. rapae TaxID=485398 RepID=A0A8J5TVK4_FUSOX|nr:hypothetical protein Forpe1208_v005476 [Fusarium oxysporum f. sp. rapae]
MLHHSIPHHCKILEQLSVIEGLVRGIQPSTSFDFPTAAAISSHQEQQNSPADAHPLQNGIGPDTEPIVPIVLSLNLEASRGSNTDRLLQWPIFDKVLTSLPRFKFFDSNIQEVFTYLDDAVHQTDAPGAHLSSTSGSGSVNISTDK